MSKLGTTDDEIASLGQDIRVLAHAVLDLATALNSQHIGTVDYRVLVVPHIRKVESSLLTREERAHA